MLVLHAVVFVCPLHVCMQVRFLQPSLSVCMCFRHIDTDNFLLLSISLQNALSGHASQDQAESSASWLRDQQEDLSDAFGELLPPRPQSPPRLVRQDAMAPIMPPTPRPSPRHLVVDPELFPILSLPPPVQSPVSLSFLAPCKFCHFPHDITVPCFVQKMTSSSPLTMSPRMRAMLRVPRSPKYKTGMESPSALLTAPPKQMAPSLCPTEVLVPQRGLSLTSLAPAATAAFSSPSSPVRPVSKVKKPSAPVKKRRRGPLSASFPTHDQMTYLFDRQQHFLEHVRFFRLLLLLLLSTLLLLRTCCVFHTQCLCLSLGFLTVLAF